MERRHRSISGIGVALACVGTLCTAALPPPSASAFSAATLTAQTAPTMTRQPAEETVIAGSEATFSAQASGSPTPAMQWLSSTDGGMSWQPVNGGNEPTLRLSDVPAGADGAEYEARFVNPAGSVTSEPAKLTVTSAPQLSSAPTNTVVSRGGTATFTVLVSGFPPPSIEWQVSSDDGKRVRSAKRADLRFAALPDLHGAGWHVVRVVALTSKGYGIVTRRAYVECVKGLAVSRQLRCVSRTSERRHR